jgi:DNA-binding NarL/FixJ family response regulator
MGRGDGLRVLLVDDHALLADSLAVALRGEGLTADIADLSSRDRLLSAVFEDPPALVLLDLELGGELGDGNTLVRPCVQAGSRVLVVSGTTQRQRLGTALEQGAVGYVAKSAPFEDLLASTVAAARGEPVMSPEERRQSLHELWQWRERQSAAREPFERLTTRERQVLLELSNGNSVGTIAAQWVVSEATVRTQVRGVLTKLGATSQLEAVAMALRGGWLTPPS